MTADKPYQCSGNRLAIIIRKKVGVAVSRNREKRIVRQLFRSTATKSCLDLVVKIKQSGGDFEDKQAVFAQAMTEIDNTAANNVSDAVDVNATNAAE